MVNNNTNNNNSNTKNNINDKDRKEAEEGTVKELEKIMPDRFECICCIPRKKGIIYVLQDESTQINMISLLA